MATNISITAVSAEINSTDFKLLQFSVLADFLVTQENATVTATRVTASIEKFWR